MNYFKHSSLWFKKQSITKVNQNKVHFNEQVWHKQILETHLCLLSPNKIFRSGFRQPNRCLDGTATNTKDILHFYKIKALHLSLLSLTLNFQSCIFSVSASICSTQMPFNKSFTNTPHNQHTNALAIKKTKLNYLPYTPLLPSFSQHAC